MKLEETAPGMLSTDYQERFIAEYQQLQIRINGLARMLQAYLKEELNFKPKCDYNTLNRQLQTMIVYAQILETRAEIEGIKL